MRMSGPSTRAGSSALPLPPVMMAAALQISMLISMVSEFAFVPAAQADARGPHGDAEQHHARERDQKERRKKARNVQLESRLQNLISQTRTAAAGSRDELRDDRTDQRKSARNPQAAEEIRQGARDAQT